MLLISVFALIAGASYLSQAQRPENSKGQSVATSTSAGPIVIRGYQTCLPHRNTDGPQTLECAFGFMDVNGTYYSLIDTDPEYRNVSGSFGDGSPLLEMTGTFEPKEDEKYKSIGIIYVTDLSIADVPKRTTLEGTFLCLPFTDPNVLQGEECVRGIQTDAGLYYVIDFALSSQTEPSLVIGERISVSGVLTPVEQLSTDTWRKYPISGIFQVTDSVRRI